MKVEIQNREGVTVATLEAADAFISEPIVILHDALGAVGNFRPQPGYTMRIIPDAPALVAGFAEEPASVPTVGDAGAEPLSER